VFLVVYIVYENFVLFGVGEKTRGVVVFSVLLDFVYMRRFVGYRIYVYRCCGVQCYKYLVWNLYIYILHSSIYEVEFIKGSCYVGLCRCS
jgi:hypothetical protein